MKLRIFVIAAALAATPMLAQAGDAAKGKTKSMMCFSCHGADGKASNNPTYPSLAGQNAAYLEIALKDYKNGKRTSPQASLMAGMAKGLTDDDIANLAAYYSSL